VTLEAQSATDNQYTNAQNVSATKIDCSQILSFFKENKLWERGSGNYAVDHYELFDIKNMPQLSGMTCTAAACISALAYRNNATINYNEIKNATGFWSIVPNFKNNHGADGFYACDVYEFIGFNDPQNLLDVLVNVGPFIIADKNIDKAIFITGMSYQKSPEKIYVKIYDPQPKGAGLDYKPRSSNKGAIYDWTYEEFLSSWVFKDTANKIIGVPVAPQVNVGQ